MKFEAGATVSLGGVQYHIREFLGGGAVADVYSATPEGFPDVEVVIKLVRHDAGPDPLRIEAIKHEAEILSILNQAEDPVWPQLSDFAARLHRARESAAQRRIIALLDSGEVTPQEPFLIEEKAPPSFERFRIDTLSAERRILAVAHAVASVISLAHRNGLALKDFEPYTKGDRIRLRWINEELFEFKMIDWDITGGPEDMAQDLFLFGRHLYYFLMGFHLELDERGRPPVILGLGLADWERLTEGTRRILQRLLHRDPKHRYLKAEDVEADLQWWLDTLKRAETPNALDQLQDHLWRARIDGRQDRALSIADLALRLQPPPNVRQAFELWAQQAREELEKEIWFPIAFARGTLLTGEYDRAAEEFKRQLQLLQPESEAARLARLYQQLALAGSLLKSVYMGTDIRSTPEWEALNRAVTELVRRHWSEAQLELQKVIQARPEAEEWHPVKGLLNLAHAGMLLQEAGDLIAQAEPRRADAERSDWIETEKQHIQRLERAVARIKEATQLAPQEPEFQERLRTEKARLHLRQGLLSRYEDAQTIIHQGNNAYNNGQQAEMRGNPAEAARHYEQAVRAFQSAIREFQAILNDDPSQYRAHLLLSRLQPRCQEAEERWKEAYRLAEAIRMAEEARKQAESHFRQGAYREALPYAQQAARLLPDREDMQNLRRWAEAGSWLEHQAEAYLEAARQYFKIRNLEEAHKSIKGLQSWAGSPFRGLPGGDSLPEMVRSQPFLLRDDLVAGISDLRTLLQYAREQRDRVQKARSQGDYLTIITALEALERKLQPYGYALAEDEKGWLEEAQQRLETLNNAEEGLRRALSFDTVQQMLESLRGDPSGRAKRLREDASQAWLQLIESEDDIETVQDRAREGMYLLEGSASEVAKKIYAWAEEAQRVYKALDVEPGKHYPQWFDEDLKRTLSSMVETLQRLSQQEEWLPLSQHAGIWRRLRGWAEEWEKQIIFLLSGYLGAKLTGAREQLQQRNFRQPLRELQICWDATPEPFRKQLSHTERDIEHLIRALESRIGAEEELSQLAARLASASERMRFTEAVEEARQLSIPQHPDVPSDDLEDFIADLGKAAKWEESLQEKPDAKSYARKIDQLSRWIREPLPNFVADTAPAFIAQDSQVAQGLQERVEALRRQLERSITRWAEELYSQLETEAENLKRHPQPGPSLLPYLYWQARWLEQSAHEVGLQEASERACQKALERAREALQELLKKSAEDFSRMQDRLTLERVAQTLEYLRNLNQGLMDRPQDLDLPPLPDDSQYSVLKPPIPPEGLDHLIEEMKYLLEYPQELPRLEPESDLRSHIRQVYEQVRRIQEHLDYLDSGWKEVLPPGISGSASSLAQLKQETELYERLSEAMVRALDRDPMTGLSDLDRGTQERPWPEELENFSLEFLSPLRQVLLLAFTRLREKLIDQLGEQVSGILDNPPATAAEELRQKLLLKPRSKEVAQAVHKAILEAVEAKSQEALEAHQQGRARAFWKIVIDATQPWAREVPADQPAPPPKRASDAP